MFLKNQPLDKNNPIVTTSVLIHIGKVDYTRGDKEGMLTISKGLLFVPIAGHVKTYQHDQNAAAEN